MELAGYIPAFVALFVIIDPIGLAPLFVALTAGQTVGERRVVALRACLVAFGILTLFGLAGEAVLNFLGISMPAFRIAGGVLLFLTALDMLFRTPQPETAGSGRHGPSRRSVRLSARHPAHRGAGRDRHDDPADGSGWGGRVCISRSCTG